MSTPANTTSPKQYSDEMKDIINQYSNTSSKWTIYSILLFIITLIAFSLIIEYPETINAKLRIISQNQPFKLIAKSNGNLILFCTNKDTITKENMIVGYVKSDANYNDINNLRQTLNKIQTQQFEIKILENFLKNSHFNLGSNTSYYNGFIDCVNKYIIHNNFLVDSLTRSKLNEQLHSLNQRELLYAQSIENSNSDLEIQNDRFNIDSTLYHKEVILTKEYQESKLRLLRSKQTLNQTKLKLQENFVHKKQTQFEIKNYEINKSLQNIELYLTILNSFRNLVAQIESWESKHVLKSLTPGIIEVSDFKENEQYVQAGEKIAKILPFTRSLKGQIFIPTKGAGEVKPGSTINISLDDYSYFDYGYLKGKLLTISNVTDVIDNTPGYWGELVLDDSLQSSFNKEIQFTHEMQGQAEIITRKEKLFFRIFKHINQIFKS